MSFWSMPSRTALFACVCFASYASSQWVVFADVIVSSVSLLACVWLFVAALSQFVVLADVIVSSTALLLCVWLLSITDCVRLSNTPLLLWLCAWFAASFHSATLPVVAADNGLCVIAVHSTLVAEPPPPVADISTLPSDIEKLMLLPAVIDDIECPLITSGEYSPPPPVDVP